MHSRVAREERKDGAMIGQAERDKRSPAGQIAALDIRLGLGVGAKKERARLRRQLTQTKKKK